MGRCPLSLAEFQKEKRWDGPRWLLFRFQNDCEAEFCGKSDGTVPASSCFTSMGTIKLEFGLGP